jgi:hypothetical protein
MEDKTTATLMDLAVATEDSLGTTEMPSKAELPSASTEAQSTTKALSTPEQDCIAFRAKMHQ